MKNAALVLVLTAVPFAAGSCRAAGSVHGRPFWKSALMEHEPVLFVQEEGQPVAAGKLFFVPSATPRIESADLQTTYEPGRDFVWHAGSNRIELCAGSRIPFKTSAEMVPPPGSPNTLQGVLFCEGHFFHDLQVQISYPHAGTWPLQDAPIEPGLARTRARLESRQPLCIVALGDSITEGYNASGFRLAEAAPHQPAFPQLVADTLQERFGGTLTLTNLGRAGTTAGWGLEQIGLVRDARPDLVILAFGMNHSETAPEFEALMRQLRDAIQAACPAAELVLVAPMTGNPRSFPAERFCGYREALRNLCTDQVALADVTSPWLALLERKPFSDLGGNNFNHPNDFGHRLYAAVICELFPLPARVRK